MSFRRKLALAFSLVLFFTIIVALTNWLGMGSVITRQSRVDTFTSTVEMLFYRMLREEQAFSATGKIVHSRGVNAYLANIRSRFKERPASASAHEGENALHSVVDALESYEVSFTEYAKTTIAMQTMRSRMLKESQRLVANAKKLSESFEGLDIMVVATNSDGSSGTVEKTERRLTAKIQYLMSTLLLAEKDYILSGKPEAVSMVDSAISEIISETSDIQKNSTNRANQLKAYRIAKVSKVYLDIFNQFVEEQQRLQKSESLMKNAQVMFNDSLTFYIEKERNTTREHIQFLQFLSISISILAIVLGIAAVFILSRLITKPIQQLMVSAHHIVEGNLDTSVKITSNDDIGALGRLFNKMTTRLKQSFSRIEEYQLHLEELVKERTEKLQNEIAERQDTEEALRASSERLRNIIDQSPMGIAIFDRDFKVISWNPSCEKIFGYSRSAIMGQTVLKIMDEEVYLQVKSIFSTMEERGEAVRNRNENITSEGRTIFCDWYNTPLTDSNNQVIGMLCLVENVTEQIHWEKEILKIKKLESTGVLAGGIAHDFNNILTAILGNINLSLLDNNLESKTRTLLLAAEKASHRAQTLTQQLLTFAKGGEPVLATTSLAEVIIDSADFVLHGSSTSVRYNIPDDLWMVEVDRGQISQVIQNIVLNGSQAMPGGGYIEITCENFPCKNIEESLLSENSEYVKITISDNGVGVPSHVLEKIFDPYFSTKKEGSGLGLAITLSIVNKHHGRISVESEPGSGTVFTIYLPATKKMSLPDQSISQPDETVKKARILLMDDEDMVLHVAGSMLTALGHEVISSRDGDECLHIYKEQFAAGTPPDLVIMDLTIPGGKGGRETMSELRLMNPQIKVVVSSGYSNDPIMASFTEYGFSAAIAKPYVMQDLSDVIGRTLQ
jgi:PAS domain S-box-containing protein